MVTLIPVYNVYNGPIYPTKIVTALIEYWTVLNSESESTELLYSLIVTHSISFINNLVRLVSNRGDVARLYSKCKLHHPITQNHGIGNEPNTFIRGSQRIDNVFCTKEISSFITICGIPSFGYISSSDDRRMYIDMKLVQYLRNIFINTNVNNSRLLQSKYPSKGNKYKEDLISFMKKRKIISTFKDMKHKLNQPTFSYQDMIQINKADNTLTRGMIKVEENQSRLT